MSKLHAKIRKTLDADRKNVSAQIKEMQKLDAGPDGDPGLTTMLIEARDAIDTALAKITDGRFGRCDACGGAISDARLEEMPLVQWCIECAENDGRPSKKKKAAPAKAAKPATPVKVAKAAKPKGKAKPAPEADDSMKVWIDQDTCEGHGTCVKACPSVFTLHKGKAYVTEGKRRLAGPDGLATVPAANLDAVLKAVKRCPTSAIYIEAG